MNLFEKLLERSLNESREKNSEYDYGKRSDRQISEHLVVEMGEIKELTNVVVCLEDRV